MTHESLISSSETANYRLEVAFAKEDIMLIPAFYFV